MPRPSVPIIQPMASQNSTSDEAFERLPELVLEALHADRVAAAVRQEARHEEAAEARAAFGIELGQHQVGVALRRREEPFVTHDHKCALAFLAEAGPGLGRIERRGARRVGAHVGAALLFGHAHADQGAALLLTGSERGSYSRDRIFGSQRAAMAGFWRNAGTEA
jgi:hypothetical protein